MTGEINISMELINKFVVEEYGYDENYGDYGNIGYNDLENIQIAYTTHEDTLDEIEVYVDLLNFRIKVHCGDKTIIKYKKESLKEFNKDVLENLEFNDLVSV